MNVDIDKNYSNTAHLYKPTKPKKKSLFTLNPLNKLELHTVFCVFCTCPVKIPCMSTHTREARKVSETGAGHLQESV